MMTRKHMKEPRAMLERHADIIAEEATIVNLL
jgi:hypothetical protein